MRLFFAVLVILFGAALAIAQKKDPMMVRSHPSQSPFGRVLKPPQKPDPMLAGSHANKRPATSERSLSPDAVTAALNRKSTTANDLAKIERGSANQPNAVKPKTAHTSAPNAAKDFGAGPDDKENRNKPVKVSRAGVPGHHSYHPKTKAD